MRYIYGFDLVLVSFSFLNNASCTIWFEQLSCEIVIMFVYFLYTLHKRLYFCHSIIDLLKKGIFFSTIDVYVDSCMVL